MMQQGEKRWLHLLRLSVLLIGAMGTTAVILILLCPAALAVTVKERYMKADACREELLGNKRHQQYRDKWLNCIEMYLSVHRNEPAGPWAAAGLYQAAQLYLSMHEISYRPSDMQTGIDLLSKIVSGYPKSRYSGRARDRLAELNAVQTATGEGASAPQPELLQAPAGEAEPAKASGESPSPEDASSEDSLKAAAACLQKITVGDEALSTGRSQWLVCIDLYKSAYDREPSGEWGAESLFMAGSLYGEVFRRFHLLEDKISGLNLLAQVTKQFPSSPFRKKAQDAFATLTALSPVEPVKVAEKPKKSREPQRTPAPKQKRSSEPPSKTETLPDPPPAEGPVIVTNVRYWSNPSYTRIVVDADRQSPYTYELIDRDKANGQPTRLFVDLKGARLGRKAEKLIAIDDNLLLNVRSGQLTQETVRVVVDFKSFGRYKIFSLKDPFRIVLDVWGAPAPQQASRPEPKPEVADRQPTAKKMQLAKQLALGVRRIVIDAGHGGWDFGAKGYLGGVYEKDVVLKIANRLAGKIRKDLGCEVVLTRAGDRFLALEERTAIANTKNADLFISIHTNAVESHKPYGIETYYLSLATDDAAIMLAAKENATSTRNISDLQNILNDLMQNTKIHESSRLASHVQSAMVGHLGRRYDKIKNKGVKQAPFYVLLGAQMPAILVETSFISNRRECERLVSDAYQEAVCEAIVAGIRSYIKETNPTALEDVHHRQGGSG